MMADEKKTFLLKVESNLKELGDSAVDTKKKIQELKDANDLLTKSGQKGSAEYEVNIAKQKLLQKEYNQTLRSIGVLTSANKTDATTRDKLNAIITIETQKLKQLGDGLTTNAAGLTKVNPLYIQQKKNLADANLALIQYDQSLNSGKTNIGRYGESVSAAFADAGKSILSMISPMALVAAGIAAAKKVFDGLKEAIMSTTFGMDTMNKIGAVTSQMWYNIAINGKLGIETMISASKIQGELNKLRVEEGFETLKLSKINREEQAVRELSIDRTKTHAERLEYLNQVTELETEKTKINVDHLQKELAAKNDLLKQQPANEKLGLEILAIMAKINDTYAEEDAAMRWVNTQRTGFIQEEVDARKKLTENWMKEIDDQNKAADEAEKKLKDIADKAAKTRHDQDVTAENEAQSFIDKELSRMDKEAEDKWNAEVEFQRKLYDSKKKAGQDEFNLRVKQEEALAEATLRIQKELAGSRMNLAKSVSNFFNSIAGENKVLQDAAIIADGAMAIAEVIIKTTQANAMIRATAAASVLPGPGYLARLGISMAAAMAPINLNRIAAGIDIAAIIAAMSGNIKSNNQSMSSTSSATATGETSIVTQRNFAQQTGSTILTQPQLTQPQLNSIQSSGSLSADDIAKALKNMPAPVVTVEDINARAKSVRKVSVRANI